MHPSLALFVAQTKMEIGAGDVAPPTQAWGDNAEPETLGAMGTQQPCILISAPKKA